MAFNDDEKPPASTNAGNTKGLVTMKPVKYSKVAAALTADTVTAMIEVNATSSAVREGLDLVAVLDASRNDGEKMESMKKAMVFVITKLTAVDRLSIVSFSDGATRHSPLLCMTPAAQNDLISLVNGLRTRGRTNIEAGLETALAMIADRVHTKARTASIFLMSDGHQTAGDARQVDPGQVPIYTFGFGKDANHLLMSDIVMSSPGGTFSSVLDGSKVSLPFSQLLGGLLTVVAQDVQLTVTPHNTEEGDVDTIVVAPGVAYTLATDADTGVVTVKLGTLFAGEARRVAITLTLKDVSAATSEEYEALLAEVQHSFTAQGKQRDLQIPQDIQIRRTPPATSQAMDDGEDDQLVNSLRKELEQLNALMNTQELYGAQAGGGPIALATETCHGRRRYAARGDDGDVRLFATPRMDTYLEQAKNFDNDPIAAPLPSSGDEDDAKQEIMMPISPEFTYYLRNAIVSLQAIENLDKVPSHGDVDASSKGKKARQVQAEIARQEHAETIRQARLLADDGRLDEARCKLQEALDDGKKLVNSLHAELEQLVKLMETRDLYEAQGRPFALASETCHGRLQRYAVAAMGADKEDDDDVPLFATARMDTYREQAKNFENDLAADEDVKEEVAANPLAAVSTELAFYLRNAIQALQAVDKIISSP